MRLLHGILRQMAEALEQLPMSLGYFRLVLRCFGDTPERQAAILAGTGVTDEMLRDPSADISLFQQVRQIENVTGLFGDGWALRAPEMWNASSHGPLGVAGIAAPDMATMMDVITQFGFVRAPFYRTSLRRGADWSQVDYELTVDLDERLWRPMMEISFMGIRAGIASMLAAPPAEARFSFACAEPEHAPQVRAILGDHVAYGAQRNAIRFPTAWLALQSPFADATLYAVALHELQAARARLTAPVGLRGRVERLLKSLPAGRLTADEVARLTGVSRRTLVRRLSEAGAGYRELVDAELRGRAERLLRDGDLSHAQIAEQLGYTDPSSFSRACRRWFRGPIAPS
ncbi:AraC family transcriptional regulator [Phenylobacterium sp.]|uniref:helix-turn-helix domain-containing protein n=1 Tax=Phenylobacterium sp. TaxID=1871053 RepID=UPI00273688A0|nr:AraC family transcriptional regulator [Phenylobacterium sp.]MDP3852415.1 AraC family transcriptional regulator ligand-binding domain-containing protein [Phenylobacterium sp.]